MGNVDARLTGVSTTLTQIENKLTTIPPRFPWGAVSERTCAGEARQVHVMGVRLPALSRTLRPPSRSCRLAVVTNTTTRQPKGIGDDMTRAPIGLLAGVNQPRRRLRPAGRLA